MQKEDKVTRTLANSNNNKNSVKVNNQFNLTVHLGDSLNLLALLASIFVVKKITAKQKAKKVKM